VGRSPAPGSIPHLSHRRLHPAPSCTRLTDCLFHSPEGCVTVPVEGMNKDGAW